MFNRFSIVLLLVLATAFTATAQRGVCGLSSEADDMLADMITAQKKELAANPQIGRSLDPVYIPIRFHPVGETNGTGHIKRSAIVRMLKVINDDFAQVDFVFYHDEIDWVNVNNTSIFTNPGSNTGLLTNNRVEDAVNVFVTENASTGSQLGGTTLGYYSPNGDFVVSRKQEFLTLTNTMSHELGHFFSLPHTHRGWDAEEWEESLHGNPLNSCTAPGGGQVEFADRSNCETAADRLCDTREDYNFGFSNPNNCQFSRTVLDCNGDEVDPDEDNQMGYFSGCSEYTFSPQQIEMMTANYNGSTREYIRDNYVPVQDEITERVSEATPNTNNDEIASNVNVVVDWEDIAGATHYIVEMEVTGGTFDEYWIVTESTLTIDELPESTKFNYRVYPFNETQTTTQNPRLYRFTTPMANAVAEVAGLNALSIFPNPLSAGQQLSMSIDLQSALSASIALTAINGERVYNQLHKLGAGSQTVTIQTEGIVPGLYIATIETADGVSQRKVMIK